MANPEAVGRLRRGKGVRGRRGLRKVRAAHRSEDLQRRAAARERRDRAGSL